MVNPEEMARSQESPDLSPLLLAEDLDITVLNDLYAEKIKKFDINDPSEEAAELTVHLGGICLERGLNPSVDPHKAAAYLAKSGQYFQLADMHPATRPPLRYKAQKIKAYMPAFTARRHAIDSQYHHKVRMAPPETHLKSICKELAKNAFDLNYAEPSKRLGFLSSHGVSLLLARAGRLDYPTTMREQVFNENYMAFWQGSYSSYSIVEGHKLPMLASYRSERQDECPHRITVNFSNLIEKWAPETHPVILDRGTRGKICSNVVGLLIREANQWPVQSREIALLDALSNDLITSQNNLLASLKNSNI